MTIEQVAATTHEANRVLQGAYADPTIPVALPWDDAPAAQKASVIAGVINILDGTVTTPADSHESWCQFKYNQGWKWGPVKDEAKQEHPLLVPHSKLSLANQAKDMLFFAIVNALRPIITGWPFPEAAED